MEVALTPSALVDRAMESTGLGDLGSDHFSAVLDAWCADLAADRLSDQGRSILVKLAQRNLDLRLALVDTFRRHPEIGAVPLPPIVRIVGFPRSGTTLLHQLMSLRPNSRALLRWELVRPLPPPEAASYTTDPRIALVQRSVDALKGTDIERMHWVEAADPEECAWGFFDLSGLLGRACIGLMPSWTEAVMDVSRTRRETYEEYRRLVQLLLWRNPIEADGVLVLKCPTDVGHLATFLDVFPEAKVVLCHRDPFRTVTSGARIKEVVHETYLVRPGSTTADEGRADADTLAVQAGFADAMVEAARTTGDRLTSVRYADLMADPSAAVAAAFAALSISTDPATTSAAVRRFVEDQRAGRRAAPPSSYGDYGYTTAQVRTHPSMARYLETFDVAAEEVRITQPSG